MPSEYNFIIFQKDTFSFCKNAYFKINHCETAKPKPLKQPKMSGFGNERFCNIEIKVLTLAHQIC